MDEITSYFAKQGILGIVVVMLIGVIVWQQKRIDAKDLQINDLQNKRKQDADGYTSSFTATTREMVAAQKDGVNAINLLQRSVESLTSIVQSFINGNGKGGH